MGSISRVLLAVVVASGCAAAGVLAACGGGSGGGGTGGGGTVDEAGVPSTADRPAGTRCEKDAGDEGGHTYSASVCATSVGMPGCRMCLSNVDPDAGDEMICVNACHIGSDSECPAGQTCVPQPNGNSSTGNCVTPSAGPSALGFCR
jgi:hypothetical protein